MRSQMSNDSRFASAPEKTDTAALAGSTPPRLDGYRANTKLGAQTGGGNGGKAPMPGERAKPRGIDFSKTDFERDRVVRRDDRRNL